MTPLMPRYRRHMAFTPQPLPPVSLSEHLGVRYLHLGSIYIQGAMRLRKPERIELDYVQRMLASLLWLPTESLGQGQAVQLGLGAGAITRFTAGPLGMKTTVVEINKDVVRANALFFFLPMAAEVVIGDAADWLTQAAPGSVRMMHVDVYDHEAAAPVLDDQDFYSACRDKLEEGGVFAVNLFGRNSSFRDSINRIAQAFGSDQVWSLQPTREGNTVVVAGRGVQVPDRATLTARAETLHTRFADLGLPAHKWLRMVRPYQSPEQTPEQDKIT